ncbi:MAG: thiol reductant ABC exporter subunit CydD [Rhodospirillales bacterium]
MSSVDPTKSAARAWIGAEQRLGFRAVRPILAMNLLGTMLAIGQVFAVSVLLTGRDFATFANLFAALAVARAGLSYAAERLAFGAGASARRRLRTDLLGRLLAAGPAMLRIRHSVELTAIVVDRVEALDGLFSRYIPAALFALGGPVVVLVAVVAFDPWSASVLLGCGLLVPIAMAAAGIGAAAAARGQFLAMERLQARFVDRIRGIATIVLYGRTEQEAGRMAAAADELRLRTMRVLRVAFLSSAALDLAAALALVSIAVHFFPGSGDMTTALFVLLLVPEFFAPLRAFSAAYQDRLHATGAAEAMLDVPPLPAPAPPRDIRTVAAQGITVAFEDVRFTWDPTRPAALNGLSFRAAPGEILVLAGPSGAGKSTVIEMLLGFIHPDSGRVTINGADISDVVPQALSRFTAWIGQRPVLFAGTIRDNIRFARPEATDAQVDAAAASARVADFADTLPQGLDTPVGDGGFGLSGGQAQRVAIARAYLKNAPLLLLDEPTAHLDPATEADVLESLKRLAIGRTVILASHAAAAHAFGGQRLNIRGGRAA